MGSSSELGANWDFSHGKRFQREVLERFRSGVHHPSSSLDGSFFLLATFRRYTFRLTEDSVSLALQSCLGGSAAGFHVKFLSDRHFRFSVASKAVGFHVYNLRRFIGSTFDVYFHLWNDGVAHWERDKRIWEEEQAKEWTLVTRKKKSSPNGKAKQKHVSFATRLVQASPPVKHKPNLPPAPLKFGSFTFEIDENGNSLDRLSFGRLDEHNNVQNLVGVSTAFARLQKDLQMDQSLENELLDDPRSSEQPKNTQPEKHADSRSDLSAPSGTESNSNIICLNCLGPGHAKAVCTSPVRCKSCYNYGHRSRWCYTRARPKLMWAPKKSQQATPVKQPDGRTDNSNPSTIHLKPSSSAPSSANTAAINTATKDPATTINAATTPLAAQPSPDNMANFPVNPMLFAPAGANIEDGWQRPARGRLALGGEPPRLHEEYGIVTLVPPPAVQHRHEALEDVIQFLEEELNVRIRSSSFSPLGLGLLQFQSPTQRQSMIDLSPIPFGPLHQITVVQHDRGFNLKACNYIRECTIMFLAFPLDYQSMDYIKAAVAPFGRLLFWDSTDNNKSRVLVRVLVLSPDRIPRSLIVSQGTMLGGQGRSWTVPVYILDGGFPDAFPGGEDPVPLDGNPHPLPHHLPAALGNQHPGWIQEQQGGANEDNPFVNNEGQEQFDDAEEEWVEVIPGEHMQENMQQGAQDVEQQNEQQNILNVQNAVPHHPEQEQDVISFGDSRSTAQFFRANGPDIPINLVFARGSTDSSDGSSSSSDATSMNVMQNTQTTMVMGPSLPPEIIMDRVSLGETVNKNIARKLDFDDSSFNNLAIVPYRPVLPSVMLQLWAQNVSEPNLDEGDNSDSHGSEHKSDDSNGQQASSLNESPEESGTDSMEMQLTEMEIDMQITIVENSLTNSANQQQEKAVSSKSKVATRFPPPRSAKTPKKGILMNASNLNPAESSGNAICRRSPRLDKKNDGCYKHVKLTDTPRKKRKNVSKVQDQASLVSKLDNIVDAITENPEKTIPVELMQDMGTSYCQLSPEEITVEKLQKAKVTNGN
ncbi:hypothetical protein EJB05_33589, partial [Eragrostis curvula]